MKHANGQTILADFNLHNCQSGIGRSTLTQVRQQKALEETVKKQLALIGTLRKCVRGIYSEYIPLERKCVREDPSVGGNA